MAYLCISQYNSVSPNDEAIDKKNADLAPRNLGYEFFKASHLFAVVIFMLTFFWHCDYTLTSW